MLVGSALPPTCMLERFSFTAGTRLMAPAALPSTRMMRLSPFLTSGRYFCAMKGSRKVWVKSSRSDEKFWSPSPSRNTPAPPLP